MKTTEAPAGRDPNFLRIQFNRTLHKLFCSKISLKVKVAHDKFLGLFPYQKQKNMI